MSDLTYKIKSNRWELFDGERKVGSYHTDKPEKDARTAVVTVNGKIETTN